MFDLVDFQPLSKSHNESVIRRLAKNGDTDITKFLSAKNNKALLFLALRTAGEAGQFDLIDQYLMPICRVWATSTFCNFYPDRSIEQGYESVIRGALQGRYLDEAMIYCKEAGNPFSNILAAVEFASEQNNVPLVKAFFGLIVDNDKKIQFILSFLMRVMHKGDFVLADKLMDMICEVINVYHKTSSDLEKEKHFIRGKKLTLAEMHRFTRHVVETRFPIATFKSQAWLAAIRHLTTELELDGAPLVSLNSHSQCRIVSELIEDKLTISQFVLLHNAKQQAFLKSMTILKLPRDIHFIMFEYFCEWNIGKNDFVIADRLNTKKEIVSSELNQYYEKSRYFLFFKKPKVLALNVACNKVNSEANLKAILENEKQVSTDETYRDLLDKQIMRL